MILSILFFSLYFAIVVLIGVISARFETEEGFMLAERKVHGLQLAATMSAGFFDGAVLSIYLAYVYQFGFSALWLFAGAAVGYLVLRFYSKRIKSLADQFHCYSMPEFFGKVIGKKSRLLFSAVFIFQFFLLVVVDFIVSGKILASIFPVPYPIALSIGGGIILTYLMLAGFKAVIRTDFFQLIIMFLMSISVAWFLLGGTPFSSQDFYLWNLGPGNTVVFVLIGVMNILVAPDLWQRIFASRDKSALRSSFVLAAIFLAMLGIIISVVGIATRHYFPSIVPEDAFLVGFNQLLPYGLKQFGLVLLYAVALSSCDTLTFVVSSILTRDLQEYVPKFSEKSMRKLTRIFMIAFVLLAVGSGLVFHNIVTLGLSFASMGLALFPAIFGSFYFKLKDNAVFWSLILAMLSIAALFVLRLPITPENVSVSLPVALVSLLILQPILKRT